MANHRRGTDGFSVTREGSLLDNPENAELLRRLWIGREIILDDLLGPGDPGDFDFGAWHVSCHLVAAGGVLELRDGALAWLEVSHDQAHDTYYPSLTVETDSTFSTLRLDSQDARERLADARVLGFVEGTSLGRISARGVHDPEARFNGNPRQEYDEPPDSTAEGGKVWEHWCTLRDVRDSATIASSVLAAYVTLCAHLGDLFPVLVARGRRAYGHPAQFAAMVRAGFIGTEAASHLLQPSVIPDPIEALLKAARPARAFEAVKQLDWSAPPCYYMFSRSIDQWNPEGVPKDAQ